MAHARDVIMARLLPVKRIFTYFLAVSCYKRMRLLNNQRLRYCILNVYTVLDPDKMKVPLKYAIALTVTRRLLLKHAIAVILTRYMI